MPFCNKCGVENEQGAQFCRRCGGAMRPEEPEKKSNVGMIIGVIAVVGVGGAAYYYFKFVRGKKQKDEDMDFFDDEGYEEEPYVNEDAEPDIAADDEDEITEAENEED